LETDLYQALDHFERAVAIEPTYARGYVGIAEAWIALAGWTGSVRPRDGFPKAKTAAQKALSIDPGLSEAYIALAFVTEDHDWNLPEAERLYQRALALSPNNALAYDRYGQFLNRTGRFDEGIVKTQRAFELDPLAIETLINLGGRLVDSRKYDEGLAIVRKAIDLEPANFEPWSHIAEDYSRAGRLDDAIAAGKRGIELSEQAPHAIQMLATIYANHNMRAEVSALLKLLEAEPPRRNPYTVAMLHLKLGDREAGLRWLGIACEERTPQIAFLRWQIRVPAFNSIRDDARFNQVVRCGERRSN